jgi:hypothetical protein
MSAFRLISGPSSFAGARPVPMLAGGGGRRPIPELARPGKPGSKKAYTGTLAGIGRTTGGAVIRRGPAGPGFGAGRIIGQTSGVRLGPRARGTAGGVTLTPRAPAAPRTPSLFARVARRARAAVFGF